MRRDREAVEGDIRPLAAVDDLDQQRRHVAVGRCQELQLQGDGDCLPKARGVAEPRDSLVAWQARVEHDLRFVALQDEAVGRRDPESFR